MMVNREDPVHAAIPPGRTAGRTAAGTAITAADLHPPVPRRQGTRRIRSPTPRGYWPNKPPKDVGPGRSTGNASRLRVTVLAHEPPPWPGGRVVAAVGTYSGLHGRRGAGLGPSGACLRRERERGRGGGAWSRACRRSSEPAIPAGRFLSEGLAELAARPDDADAPAQLDNRVDDVLEDTELELRSRDADRLLPAGVRGQEHAGDGGPG
jgi:hypothetical protein